MTHDASKSIFFLFLTYTFVYVYVYVCVCVRARFIAKGMGEWLFIFKYNIIKNKN